MEGVTSKNPPALWKQLLGFVIGTVVIFFLEGPGVLVGLVAGIFTFCDAWSSGVYRKQGVRSFTNISPMSWGLAMELLPVVAYPIYLAKKNKLKTRDVANAFWILTIITGALAIIVFVIQISLFVSSKSSA